MIYGLPKDLWGSVLEQLDEGYHFQLRFVSPALNDLILEWRERTGKGGFNRDELVTTAEWGHRLIDMGVIWSPYQINGDYIELFHRFRMAPGYKLMMHFALKRLTGCVKYYIERGILKNYYDKPGYDKLSQRLITQFVANDDLEMVKYLHEDQQIPFEDVRITTWAAYYSCNEMFKYLDRAGAPWSSNILYQIAENNNHELLDYVQKPDSGYVVQPDDAAVGIAAENGHIEMMRRLLAFGHELTSECFSRAIAGGYIECVQFLIDNKCKYDEFSYDPANKDRRIIELMHKNGYRFRENVIGQMASEGNLLHIDYMKQLGYKTPNDILEYAAYSQDLNVVKKFRADGYPFTERTLPNALIYDNLPIIKFLVENGCRYGDHGDPNDYPDDTVGHYLHLSHDIFKYIVDTGCILKIHEPFHRLYARHEQNILYALFPARGEGAPYTKHTIKYIIERDLADGIDCAKLDRDGIWNKNVLQQAIEYHSYHVIHKLLAGGCPSTKRMSKKARKLLRQSHIQFPEN